MAEDKKRSLNTLIIHPSIEPGVIDNAMLLQNILAYGPKEEAGRLFAEEGVHLDEVKTVRLEFLNILRIDHLWMLRSLTKLTLAHNLIEKIEKLEQLSNLNELDLSFNKIEKIENLDALSNLEVLTLFHNRIRKIENLEGLEKLLIFSIGDNRIEDYKEMAYLRRFRQLRSVSFKGNPCCDDPAANQFIAAALNRVTYLDYKLITEGQRSKGRSLFRSLLRQLDEKDAITEKQRIAKEEYDAQVVFSSLSFVEYLSGPELIDSMFNNDPDGTILLSYGGELLTALEEYKEKYVEVMAHLVAFAQKAYVDRENELKLFRDLVENALADSIARSKLVTAAFEKKKKTLVTQMTALVGKFTAKLATLDEIEPKITELSEEFNEVVYDAWKELMSIEIELFERCEESRTQFSVNISDKITKLHEISRNAFGAWREFETNWSMKQYSIFSNYVSNTTTSKMGLLLDVVPELLEAMRDRDQLSNLIAQSTDNHMRFIDTREDQLSTRSNNWLHDIVEGNTEKEIKRNRSRIAEINFYIDNQRIEWQDLQMALNEFVDTETAATAALLGDDFCC